MNELFKPRIKLQNLAGLCRRLAITLSSGIDVRRVFEREAADAKLPAVRAKLTEISEAISHGESVTDAIRPAGDYFPALFHDMVEVGEHTGGLPEVFRHLAEHYEEQVRLRRTFISNISGPILQLIAALGVIGGLILLMGVLPTTNGKSPDIMGLGLTGMSGFIQFLLYIAIFIGVGFFVYQATRRGKLWTVPLQKNVLRIPQFGKAIATISLAQMAWTMELTMESGMDVLKAIPLWFRSTRNAYYIEHSDRVVEQVRAGHEIHEALAETGAFPTDFLSQVEVGEQSGRLPEAMKTLSRDYHEQAQLAIKLLTTIAGRCVWGLVAAMIVFMIFRIFSSYTGALNNALNDVR
ncbi:MAG TPA: type II secretion system F family protein [Pirellulales bacterium]|jgi:type IV pilus assembly protein PilC